ncbi:MAG: SIMPL domain-containing protein [bacterium]|nr:SIMPL domain-containing protein [bacterium]
MIKEAKNYFWVLIDVALIVTIVFGTWCAVYYVGRYTASLPITRTITISAEGKIVAEPDIAKLSFSVVSEGKDPEVIQRDNTVKMNDAIAFIKAQDVDAKDIKTSGYNLSPRYDYDEKKRTSYISGYTLTQTVSVQLRDFAKISPILGQLPSLGINQIQGVNFEVEDPEKYLVMAREEAFDRAYSKAAAMARQNGVRIGRVVTFSEGSQGGPIYLRSFEAMAMKSDGGAPAPTIEPGSEEVRVNVSVTYELR